MDAERAGDGRLRRWWRRLSEAVSWTPPTSTEVGVVVKSGLAAGLSWFVAGLITGVEQPVLAPLTAIVVIQVSVRSSVMSAVQRSAAVVLGVLLAVGVGDALGLNALSITLLVVVTLGLASLVLRLPAAAARQVPVSALVVLAALSATPQTAAWQRVLDTVIGAAVGVLVAIVLPASRRVDARQTIDRLGVKLADVLEAMGAGLQGEWSVAQTDEWRRRARTTRERLVRETVEAVGSSREASRWNLRDRRHIAELGRYEEVLPRLERTAIGVSVIARGLDDHAHLSATTRPPMRAMGALFDALGGAVHALVAEVLGEPQEIDLTHALDQVRACRGRCVVAASRRAREALAHEHDEPATAVPLEGEWLNYAALLVQVDRIVADLNAPLPT